MEMNTIVRMFCVLCASLYSVSCSGVREDLDGEKKNGPRMPFFAMDNYFRGAKGISIPQRMEILSELGYEGFSTSDLEKLPEMIQAADEHILKLFAVYFGVWIDGDKPGWDPKLDEMLPLLKGRGTVLWPNVQSKTWKSSDPAGDKAATEILRQLADRAGKMDLNVAIYPHTWFWVETTGDAVRLAEKVDRANVGITFNLCHWLKADSNSDLRAVLRSAGKRLWMVSTHGADSNGRDWPQLIQTLDRGTFDQKDLLRALHEIHYAGPVGLQGYNVKGDPKDNLTRSMNAWKALTQE